MVLKDEHQAYTPAVRTDVLALFRRHGWTPPSEDPETLAKWAYYKSMSSLSEEANVLTSK